MCLWHSRVRLSFHFRSNYGWGCWASVKVQKNLGKNPHRIIRVEWTRSRCSEGGVRRRIDSTWFRRKKKENFVKKKQNKTKQKQNANDLREVPSFCGYVGVACGRVSSLLVISSLISSRLSSGHFVFHFFFFLVSPPELQNEVIVKSPSSSWEPRARHGPKKKGDEK